AALDQLMRVEPQDIAVLAGAGLAFVGVDDEVMRLVAGLGHEGPFHAGWKARAAAAAHARLLHLLDDPVAPLGENRGRAVPVAALLGRLEAERLPAIEIGENPVAVAQHLSNPPRRRPWPPRAS